MIRNILMASAAVLAFAGSASAGGWFTPKTVGSWTETNVVANGNSGFIGGVGQSNVTTNVNTTTGFNGTAGASSVNGDLGAGFLANSSTKTVGGAELTGTANTTGGDVKSLFGHTYKTTGYNITQTTVVDGGYAAQAGGATLFGVSKSVTSGSTEIGMNNGSFGGVSTGHASNVTVGAGAAVSSAHTSATVGGHTTLFGN